MGGRTRTRLRWLRDQASHTSRVARDRGWKAALAERSGAVIVKSDQWVAARRDVELLRAEVVRLNHRLGEVIVSRDHADDSIIRLSEALAEVDAATGEALRASAETGAKVADLQTSVPAVANVLHKRVDQLDRGAATLQHLVTDWLWTANAPLRSYPLISVIMPTGFPERAGFLQSAIASVVAQSYPNWELIVLDDSPEPFLDPPPSWWPTDPRIRLLRGGGHSEGPVRNQGIAAARGEIAAFLDDDCRWFPWWLHAVARAFGEDPHLGVVHGVRVVEGDDGGEAWTYAQALDGLTLHTANPADTNVMAHRLGLAGTDWPSLTSCADYDTVIRLRPHGAKFLPVPAATYAVSSPSRAWAPERAAANATNFRAVQRRARVARPLRVVAHNALYPLLSETYIGDELEALRRHDIDLVLSRQEASAVPSASRVDAPLFESLQEAIEHHDPDLVLMHWADVGLANRQACAAAGVPYGIRLHSFDNGHSPHDLIDSWCAGIWTYPHYERSHHLAFTLDTLLIDVPTLHAGPRERVLLSLSAALPKKDFPTLLAAMKQHPDIALDVAVATTNGFEALPDTVRNLIADTGLDARVTVDVPHETAQQMLRTAGACVYTMAQDFPIGQPRSVLEAALHGTPLVVPDDPPMHHLLGDTAHFFRRGDAASLADAIAQAIEDPLPVDARAALAERVRIRHADVRAHEAWANSVTAAVVTWQRNSRTDRVGANLRWWWPN
jgi:glycosyltransferase involved in cell wall biosynthesis